MEQLYKILTHDAKAAHGGELDYTEYLPRYKHHEKCLSHPCPVDDCNVCSFRGKWIKGKKITVTGDLKMCQNGIHLTSKPLGWKVMQGRIFLCSYDGVFIKGCTDKACFRSVQLIAELGIDSLNQDVRIFKMISLRSANLRYADLSYADLRSANLRSADLSYADLSSANLSSADLSSANLSSANLSSADLRYADLRSANLSSADLRYADLRSADLRYADLRSADLSYANLSYADLRSADLSSANLSSADSLNGIYIDTDPKIIGYKFRNGKLWRG